MTASPFDDYFATLPDAERAALERIRAFVRENVPSAVEGKSYGMPAFRYRDRPLVGVRAGKQHLSVFPFSPAAIEVAAEALQGFDLAKGTVRFTVERPLPDEALAGLLRARMKEIEEA